MERTPSVLGMYLKGEGVTVAAFARRIGKTHGAVWRWAFTERTPTLEIAALIERETGGGVPMSSWSHGPSVCHVAAWSKSTKRGRNRRAGAKSRGIARRPGASR